LPRGRRSPLVAVVFAELDHGQIAPAWRMMLDDAAWRTRNR
jgi:hypothetical protein